MAQVEESSEMLCIYWSCSLCGLGGAFLELRVRRERKSAVSLLRPPISEAEPGTKMPNPTILIITGAWHVPAHYHLLVTQLEAKGYIVLCPCLPSNSGPKIENAKKQRDVKTANKSLDDDIAFIRDIAVGELGAGRDVLAIMHSYGGVVGTTALSELHGPVEVGYGCVRQLMYMSAFVPFSSEGLAGVFGGVLPPWLSPNKATGNVDIDDAKGHLYNDLSEAEGRKWERELVVHAVKCQLEAPKEKRREAWRDIKGVGYVVCEDDEAMPMGVQEMMIGRVEKEGGLGKGRVRLWRLKASHSPFLSCPVRVVEAVEDACREF